MTLSQTIFHSISVDGTSTIFGITDTFSIGFLFCGIQTRDECAKNVNFPIETTKIKSLNAAQCVTN